jgi:hypothetical protein
VAPPPNLQAELAGWHLLIDTRQPGWGQTDAEWCSKFTGAMTWYATRPTGQSFVWRGQPNAAWSLQPRLHRHLRQTMRNATFADVLREERTILKEVGQLDAPELPDSKSRLTKLAILQHHGVPTRLIDVTRDPLVATFFAAQDSVDDEGQSVDGAVLAIVDIGVEVAETRAGRISFTPKTASYGIWQAPPIDGRIISQRGYFLIASPTVSGQTPDLNSTIGIPAFDPKGPKKQPVATIFTNLLRGGGKVGRPPKITPNLAMFLVPFSRKPSLRRLLQSFGLTTRTIYPDLAGYASSFPPS